MSRTVRGSKAGGYDYWSRRPCSGNGFGPGVKKACHRTERQQAARSAVEQLAVETAADTADDAYLVHECAEIDRLYGTDV